MISEAAYRVGDFCGRARPLEQLAADATEADRLRALDMRARVDWAADRAPVRWARPGTTRRRPEHRRHWTGSFSRER